MANEQYHEFTARHHRMIANYLASRLWRAGLDAVLIPSLKEMLLFEGNNTDFEKHLDRFKKTVKPWFSEYVPDLDTSGIWLARGELGWDVANKALSAVRQSLSENEFKESGKRLFPAKLWRAHPDVVEARRQYESFKAKHCRLQLPDGWNYQRNLVQSMACDAMGFEPDLKLFKSNAETANDTKQATVKQES